MNVTCSFMPIIINTCKSNALYMGSRTDIVTVDIEKPLYNKLFMIKEKKGISIRKYVYDVLLMNLEKEEFLRQYVPFLSIIGIQDNILYIKDAKKDKIIEIRMKNGKLQSNDSNPTYLQYAMALPELVRLK